MNRGIVFLPEDYCTECNKEHMIELYDTRNRPLGYTGLLESKEKLEKAMNTSEFSYFRCKSCGVSYGIFWRRPGFIPEPFRQMFLLNNFEQYDLGDRRC